MLSACRSAAPYPPRWREEFGFWRSPLPRRMLTGLRRPWAFAALAWAALLAGALILSVLAAREPRLPADLSVARTVQGWPVPGTALSDAVRAVTSTEVVLGVGGALAVGLWLAGVRRPAVALALGLLVLPILQAGLKELVDRPRPSPDLVDVRAGFSSPSFPSGHVMSPTLLYGFVLYLCFRLPRALALAGGLWSAAILALTGLVNVFLGVHWPSDVLGGYAWGLVLLLLVIGLAAAITRPSEWAPAIVVRKSTHHRERT